MQCFNYIYMVDTQCIYITLYKVICHINKVNLIILGDLC